MIYTQRGRQLRIWDCIWTSQSPKSSVWTLNTRDTMLPAVQELCVVSPDQATLLGSPIGSINSAIRSKVNTLKIIGSRIPTSMHKDAFCLLHHAYSIPKMLYILRSSPCFLSSQLDEFDHLQSSILSDIANIGLVNNNSGWAQASLPCSTVWWSWYQLRCPACTFRLSGLCCWLLKPDPPDPSSLVTRHAIFSQ